MPITLQATFRDTLKAETVELIDELLGDNHDLQCMLTFIDEYNEDDFCTYYETYVEQGEKVGYEVVEAFIEEEGFCDVEHCEDAFVGIYADGATFAEELSAEMGENIPDWIVVDWDMTWERGLSYDYTLVEKGFRNCFIFRKYY
jgi:regulator of RNase E activity RraB